MGSRVMAYNYSGFYNTATGYMALYASHSGIENTAVGYQTLYYNYSGSQNTAIGNYALRYNSTGQYNTAIGYNTGFGYGVNYTNTTCLGNGATVFGSNIVRIGNSSITSIGGYQNWTNISDGRFKTEIQENVPGLSFITQLRPITYRLDREKIDDFTGLMAKRQQAKEEDPNIQTPDRERYSQVTTGFIAQEVEQAALSVGFDFSGIDKSGVENGGLYGLRYAEFVVPLVKAVQEQQQMISNQQAVINEQQKQIEDLSRRVEHMENSRQAPVNEVPVNP